ncbi:MAG: hypothetical protein NVSMB27_15280 [Ktedonobacteraceae bacterium]
MTVMLIILVVVVVFVGALLPISLHTSISLIGLVGLTVAGLTVTTGWRHIDRSTLLRLVPATLLYGLSLPAIIVATLLGIVLHRRIPTEKFIQYVFLIIVVLGILLLVNRT